MTGDLAWINDYIGLPYRVNGRDRSGVDCYGLILLVARDRLGVELPDWQMTTVGDLAEVSRALADNVAAEMSRARAYRVDDFEPWAVVVVERAGAAHHIGLCLGNGVLHAYRRRSGSSFDVRSRFDMTFPHRSYYRWRDLFS